jgi:hypothetical protein
MRLPGLSCGAGFAAGVMVLASVLTAAPAQAQPGAPGSRHPIRVGSVTIPPCKASRLAWCTRINVPVTLDAAYPVSGKDPFYPQTIKTARRAFDISCLRSVACHRAAPGPAWARLSVLARYLRHHPVTGRTRTPFGRKVTERVSTIKLSEMVNDAGSDSGVYRELDAAGRALLRDHDPQPLLRLTEQDIYTGTSGPVRQFNDGLYQATTCLDYPQPFSYAVRAAQTFIRDPGGLMRMDASCAARTPEVRVVGNFPAALRQVVPATPGPGDRAGATGPRLAAVGAAAAGDAVWRWYYGDGVRGWGLRGGTFRFTGSGSQIRIRLARVRWTADTRVTGTVRWNQVSGKIRARLTITGPHGGTASVRVRYSDYVRHSTAILSGRYLGQPITARLPAP